MSVAVVSICGAKHLIACLDALETQRDVPRFEVVVVFDPHLGDVPALRERYPQVRMVSNAGQRTPLELASRAIRETSGEIVLLTEDHCVPAPDWVCKLIVRMKQERAAVGGVVQARAGMSPVDWAFYFVDFFRYALPRREGPSPSLTVCNVAYRRTFLEQIRTLWEEFFHETAVNQALQERFGRLWITPEAKVTMSRHVTLREAVRERYVFGRLFGCTRLEFVPPAQRLLYTLLAPLLPLLLMGRMARTALTRSQLLPYFLRAIPALSILVLAWSWGEWLGYLTRRRPEYLVAAQELT